MAMHWKIAVAVYAGSMFFTASSYTMLVPFLPLYLLELGADASNIEFWSAATFAVCFLIGGIMAPIWGHMADSYGHKAMATRAAFMLFVTYTTGAFVQSPLQLLAMRVLQGFANGYFPMVLTIVSTAAPASSIGIAISMVQSCQLLGTICGPLIGGVLAHWFGYRASFFVAGAALLAVFILNWLMPRIPLPEQRTRPARQPLCDDFRTALHDDGIRRLVVLFFVYSAAIVALQPIMTLYIRQLDPSSPDLAWEAGIALALPSLSGALAAPCWGRFGQRRGFYLVLALGSLGAGMLLCCQGLVSGVQQLYVLCALYGLFLVGIFPSMNAQLGLHTPPAFRARAYGLSTMASQFGNMAGPLLSGAVSAMFSLSAQFWVSGILMMLAGLYVGHYRCRVRREHLSASLRADNGLH